jgi:hypothetical protein
MSTRYNFFGGLVTDGLILNLDAAKLQSYSGSGTNWYDISGNNNNGTLTNGPTLTGSGKNLAIRFDGSNDYVDVIPPNFNRSETSICMFYRYDNPTVNYPLLMGNGTSTSNESFYVTALGPTYGASNLGKMSAFFKAGNTTNQVTGRIDLVSNIVTTGSPFYLVITYKSSGTANMYINGTFHLSKPTTSDLLNPQVGSFVLGGGSPPPVGADPFNGNISIFQMYNKALSPFEVYQNFNALKGRYGIPDIVTSGLTLNLDAGNPYSYSPLNTGSTTWTDVSGNGNNGTLTNGASYTGGTIFLDGTDDYVNCGTGSTLTFNDGTNLNDIPFTIGVWVKFNSVSGYQLVIAKSDYGSSPNKREFLFFTNADSRIHINLMNSDNYNNRIGRYYNTVLSTNTWYHMFATYDGSKLESGLKIYINGVRVDDTSDSAGTYSGLSRTTTPFSFGTDWNNYPNQGNKLSGYYGLGQVYRRELSAGEIAQNFNATRGRYGI